MGNKPYTATARELNSKVGRSHHECECYHVAKTGPAVLQSEQLSEAHTSPTQTDPVC